MRKRKFILTVETGKFNWRENKWSSFCVISILGYRRGVVAYFFSKVFQNLTVKISLRHHASFFLKPSFLLSRCSEHFRPAAVPAAAGPDKDKPGRDSRPS